MVIVGGGAAGVGAARRLANSGLTSSLLEAGSRLGGRAWTHEIRGLDLDLGCGWLHSADRNSWAGIAKAAGLRLDQSRAAWGMQYRGLGFAPGEQAVAHQTFGDWMHRLAGSPPASDRAADALVAGNAWNSYVQVIVGFISGAALERLSVADYMAYDENSTDENWRAPSGYGALIARSFPRAVTLSLANPVESLALETQGVKLTTRTGTIRARAVILTVSTAVLGADTIKLPAELEPWRENARLLPLGHNEKMFLEITGPSPFERETQLLGDPRNVRTGSYYIRPMDMPVIECFLGGDGTLLLSEEGPAAAFGFALDQLASLFGAGVRAVLRPLVTSSWAREVRVGGAYSYALPGHAQARAALARPFEQRVFFAGEATSAGDFSTAHGAHDSGVRAANEVIAALKP